MFDQQIIDWVDIAIGGDQRLNPHPVLTGNGVKRFPRCNAVGLVGWGRKGSQSRCPVLARDDEGLAHR